MRLWMALLVAAPACGFQSQSARPGDGQVATDAAATIDAAATVDAAATIDAAIALDAQACFGTIARVCFATPPTGPANIPSMAINTNDAPECNANHNQVDKYCVIAGTSVTLGAGVVLRAFGDKPLVLISTTAMFDLSGEIDVGSKAGTDVGAGGNPSDCGVSSAVTGSSGGAGGSFGGVGGTGNPVAGAGGIAAPALSTFPTKLRGGCKGGFGANNPMGNGTGGNGTGGYGGGAVAIVAPQVMITGQITASGAGGHGGGASKCGGGGGGSGGMIVIESALISMAGGQAALFANGGGGGQGGEMKSGGGGADGTESVGPFAIARGGTSSLHGGGGANGAAGNGNKNGDSAANMPGGGGGGGGGGGASGVIRAPGAATSMIAPAPE